MDTKSETELKSSCLLFIINEIETYKEKYPGKTNVEYMKLFMEDLKKFREHKKSKVQHKIVLEESDSDSDSDSDSEKEIALMEQANEKPKREYQSFLSKELKKLQSSMPGLSNSEYISMANDAWKQFKFDEESKSNASPMQDICGNLDKDIGKTESKPK